MADTPLKIVYITPAIYSAGGVERVITLKASYFAEQYGYDVTIIVTEGKAVILSFLYQIKLKLLIWQLTSKNYGHALLFEKFLSI